MWERCPGRREQTSGSLRWVHESFVDFDCLPVGPTRRAVAVANIAFTPDKISTFQLHRWKWDSSRVSRDPRTWVRRPSLVRWGIVVAYIWACIWIVVRELEEVMCELTETKSEIAASCESCRIDRWGQSLVILRLRTSISLWSIVKKGGWNAGGKKSHWDNGKSFDKHHENTM